MKRVPSQLRIIRTTVFFDFAGLPLSARQREPLPAVTPFQRIAYTVSMSRPASHLFEVAIDAQLPAGPVPATVEFQMPLWQPGRYAVADFAENVQEFSAA